MDYFTKIQEPKKLRIGIMTAARDSIIIISMLESFTEIRKEKSELVLSLKEDFKELNTLCRKLSELVADEKTRKKTLEEFRLAREEAIKARQKKIEKPIKYVEPAKKIECSEPKEEKHQYIKIEKEYTPQKEQHITEPKQKTEADRLEYTLAQIERKLAELQK